MGSKLMQAVVLPPEKQAPPANPTAPKGTLLGTMPVADVDKPRPPRQGASVNIKLRPEDMEGGDPTSDKDKK